MGLDLAKTSQELFVPLRKAAEAKGATVTWNGADAKNPIITIEKNQSTITLYMNKNFADVNGKKVVLDGTVFTNSLITYCPQSVIDLIA